MFGRQMAERGEEVYGPDEAALVEGWRLEQLVLAGYDILNAHVLASRFDVDLHRAVEMVEHGCDPEVATQILV